MDESTIEILEEAEEANPWWFDAMITAAIVMGSRVKKYSGDSDPYSNFMYISSTMVEPMGRVFRLFQAIKLSRIDRGDMKDHEDESILDTLIDLANYTLLWSGWVIRKKSEKTRV